MARIEVRIPAVQGDKQTDYSIDSGDLKSWKKKVGDRIQKGEIICEFDISKAVIEVSAPVSGVLVELLLPKEGEDTRTISTKRWEKDKKFIERVIAVIETEQVSSPDRDFSKDQSQNQEPQVSSPDEGTTSKQATKSSQQNLVRFSISPIAQKEAQQVASQLGIPYNKLLDLLHAHYGSIRIERRHVREFTQRTTQIVQEDKEEEHGVQKGVPRLTPKARRCARELGLREDDLSVIRGTGLDGVITDQDVQAFVSSRDTRKPSRSEIPKEQVEPQKRESAFTIIRQPSMRRTIAHNMELAWHKPTAQGTFRCNMCKLLLFKENYAKRFENTYGVKLQLVFPFVDALVRVLGRKTFPYFNAVWSWEKNEEDVEIAAARLYDHVNFGVAFDTPKGLAVLVLHNAETYTSPDLARALHELGLKAANNSYSLKDIEGETFIFNNIGGLRLPVPEDLEDERDRFEIIHEMGYSILTPNVSAELNLGVIDSHGCARVQLCFDHRLIDGGDTTRFVHAVYTEMFRVIENLKNDLRKRK